MKALKLASDLSLTVDAVTQTFLVVGKRGSGKSNTAARLVEQFHRAKLPFVVLDPVDTWWGLKAGRDGGRGLDVYIFGGRHQDLPLEPGGGALLAEVLCEHRIPMVLSVKHLSGRERSAFMVAFAQTLFKKWNSGPLHVVLEEAHEFAPQMSGSRGGREDNEAAMLGAFKRLWKLGRASGIGGTAVTQRPASLSKDITTQSEILIAHRTIGPQDVKAIGEWVKYHGERLDLLAELPLLPTGQAFVWAPEFPEGRPIGLQRTTIFLRDTYDSASTPKVGETRVEPKELEAVDLERLRTKMAATIEKAKADDPRELRKEITDLRKQLAAKGPKESVVAGPKTPILTDADRALLEKVGDTIAEAASLMHEDLVLADQRFRADIERALGEYGGNIALGVTTASQSIDKLLSRVRVVKVLDKLSAVAPPATAPTVKPRRNYSEIITSPRVATARPVARATSEGDVALGRVHRAFLTVLANRQGKPTRRNQLAVFSGYSAKSRHVDNTISALRTAGYLAGSSDALVVTEAGLDALGEYEALPAGRALIDYWIREVGTAPGAMLRVLVDAYPGTLSRDAVAEASNYSTTSRHVDNSLSYLRTLELIDGDRHALKAAEELF